MNKKEIRKSAGNVWGLLFDNSKWTFQELKKKTGLDDIQLGAVLGWLARENKIEFDEDENGVHVSMYVNLYIG